MKASIEPRGRSATIAAAVGLIALVVLAYLRSMHGGWIWDDDLHVTANPTIIGPLGLREIWTTPHANYFPLVLTNFWLQHAWWGLDPLPYHVVTVGFHALAAVGLWCVLRQLRVPGAWLGAALWALHPVQVESVAWIAELKNTQSAVFFLGAIWFYVRWLERMPLPDTDSATPAVRTRGYDYALALACAALAILSKPSTVMLPAALALCGWWLRGRVRWSDLKALAPFVALAAVASGWTVWEQKFHSGAVGAEWNQTGLERCVIAGRVIWFYLGKLTWPSSLIFIYPRWAIDAGNPLAYLPIVAAVAGLVWLGWRHGGRLRPVLFASAYFVALLFPVLGFFDVYFFRYSYVGDHFQYLASMGPLALLGAAIARLPRPTGRAVAVFSILAFGVLSSRHCAPFRSMEALWRHTVALNPTCKMAWLNLGDTYSRQHRSNEAIAAFRRGLEIAPDDAPAHNDLGCELVLVDRADEGLPHLERAVQLKPTAENLANLGNALRKLGRVPEALRQYELALQLDPKNASAHNNLGAELAEAGRLDEAWRHFEAALHEKPDDPATHENMGNALRLLGRTAEARSQLETALKLDPLRPLARKLLADIAFAAGKTDEGFALLASSVKLAPDSAEAHNFLGSALAQAGRLPEAVAAFQTAVRLKPRFVAARLNLGNALCGLQRWADAVPQFQAAAAARPDFPAAPAQLAVALVNSGRLAEAVAPFEQALRLNPESAELHDSFGQLLRALGRTREAFEQFEEAARLQRGKPRPVPR